MAQIRTKQQQCLIKKCLFFKKKTVFQLFLRQIRGTEGVVKRNNTLSLLPLPFTPPQIYLIDTKPNIPNTNDGIPLGGMPFVFYLLKNRQRSFSYSQSTARSCCNRLFFAAVFSAFTLSKSIEFNAA
jgi:hypothetical protein